MFGSAIVWAGLATAFFGAMFVIKPVRRLGIGTRRRALGVALAGIALAALGVVLPAPESRIDKVESRLDAFVPAWQFNEVHAMHVAAPPERVYEAIRRVRADEIALFRTLTWIRRGGRKLPESIMNAGDREPIIDIATRTSFVRLADDAPRELVIATVVDAPAGSARPMTVEFFTTPVPPDYAVAVMNFAVRADGPGETLVTTETRVFASSPASRRRFAAYWRLIYPGSAIIRRMWLRAVERRATAAQ